MKLSLSWIFDHIDGDYKNIPVQEIVDRFNRTVAEIEEFQEYTMNQEAVACGQIVSVSDSSVLVDIPEWKKEAWLSYRPEVRVGDYYLVARSEQSFVWATGDTIGTPSIGMLPVFHLNTLYMNGEWKSDLCSKDFLLIIDNKSINHRPDLWSHRGIAREIAALYDLSLRPIDQFITYDHVDGASRAPFIAREIRTAKCRRLTTVSIATDTYYPSPLFIALRLARIGARPIDALVDVSNYVMFDIGQPLHTFDAQMIKEKKVIVREAFAGEKLALLKGEQIELAPGDILISDGDNRPISLAGIRGGKETAITRDTKKILIEAAHFDAATIRQTSMRLKMRTEASARFEKSLDAQQTMIGIKRFLALLEKERIAYVVIDTIADSGLLDIDKHIVITHRFIEDHLGASLDISMVISILKKLEFMVVFDAGSYTIATPSFRATKDITIAEDIVEEIGRFFGYTNIPFKVPQREMRILDNGYIMSRREIKKFFAFASHMQEVTNYAFYDERFLKQIAWTPSYTISVANPQSEHWQRLVTSLIPHLIKNVMDNKEHGQQLRFFEWARRWYLFPDQTINEKQVISGILFHKKSEIDFYEGKEIIVRLALQMGLSLEWHKIENELSEKEHNAYARLGCYQEWLDQDQSAYLVINRSVIGVAGKVKSSVLSKVVEGEAFVFEIDADYLCKEVAFIKQYKPLSRYPAISYDISFLVPKTVTVQQLKNLLISVDMRIVSISLIDYFEKKDWVDQKSLAFALNMQDEERTLTHEDAASIIDKIKDRVAEIGATIR